VLTTRAINFLIELAASLTTLAGMWLGSTTGAGAKFYLVTSVFWFALMFRRRMWGLAPLNVASLAIACVNLWRSA
jgi:hypothetical protein